MIVCIPTIVNDGLDARAYFQFRSALFYVIVDTLSRDFQVVGVSDANRFSALGEFNVESLISNGLNRATTEKINEMGVSVFITEGKSIVETLDKFCANELLELRFHDVDEDHPCGH